MGGQSLLPLQFCPLLSQAQWSLLKVSKDLDGILCEQRQVASRRGELQRQVTRESDTFEKVRAGNGTGSCTACSHCPNFSCVSF